jgi:hypothetical protein
VDGRCRKQKRVFWSTVLTRETKGDALGVQGMGEGVGGKDVSDQLTDEDQLLGSRQKDLPPEKVLLLGCFRDLP